MNNDAPAKTKTSSVDNMLDRRHKPLPSQPKLGQREPRRASDTNLGLGEIETKRRPAKARQQILGVHRVLEEEAQPRWSPSGGSDMGHLLRAQFAAGAHFHSYAAPRANGLPWALPVFSNKIMLIALLSLIVICGWWYQAPPKTTISGYYRSTENTSAGAVAALPKLPTPPDQHSVTDGPQISAQKIDQILADYGSPAAGTGAIWVALGQKYGINPAYAVAFFIHESSAGTNPNWAGIKPGGATTHNVGNIICAGYATCYGRFRDYPDWQTGIEDWYRLINVEYIQGRGTHTLEQIIPIYAPSIENNVPAYVQAVTNLVKSWQ